MRTESLTNSRDYRSVLTREFSARCLRNARYSQAAFARDIGVSPSLLSEILSGRHELSRRKAETVARRMGLSESEVRTFCDAAEARSSRSPSLRRQATLRLKGVEATASIHEEQLIAIQEWYYFVILEALKLEAQSLNSSEICKKLKLQPLVVKSALARLKRIGLVTKNGSKWVAENKRLAVEGGVPSAALKKLHEQFLVKAQQAIYDQSIDRRLLTTAIVPIPKTKLAEAFARLNQFRKEFCDETHALPDKDTIYCLSLHFFELLED